ncbi:MAG TPA: hypothetical protein VFD90_01570 [Gaiellales bacterium]|jgi:hypothetical protein|nr:hypothetical protein [Gaiellales bacterium]
MRKPSAALVLASAALVMATIGTSVAASGYTITSSKQIRPGSVSLASLSKSARKALHGARGPAGQDGVDGVDGVDGLDGQDGQDGQDATNLWAQIKADGTVNAAGPGVTARTGGTGNYFVNFAQDITQCATVATQASIPNFTSPGQSTAGIQGAAFVTMSSTGVDYAPGFPSQTSVRVQTNRANGTAVSTSFTVAVFC